MGGVLENFDELCFNPFKVRSKHGGTFGDRTETRSPVSIPSRYDPNQIHVLFAVIRNHLVSIPSRYDPNTSLTAFSAISDCRFNPFKVRSKRRVKGTASETETSFNPFKVRSKPDIDETLLSALYWFQSLQGTIQTVFKPFVLEQRVVFQSLQGTIQTFLAIVQYIGLRKCFNPFKVRSKPDTTLGSCGIPPRVSIPSRYDPN